MRIAMLVEYDGSVYRGWQAQSGLSTVEGDLAEAVSKVANHPVDLTCAGRTDTGVHARGQIIHFDTDSIRSMDGWLLGVNSNLPRTVRVHWVGEVPDDFSARFSAIARAYRYLLIDNNVRPALLKSYTTCWYHPLDHEKMHAAAKAIVGEHDFTSFRSSACESRSSKRNVKYVRVSRSGKFIHIEIEANAFLHHMVRNIVGTLIRIGQGAKPVEWMSDVLEEKNRCAAGITAPPQGLYLETVTYDEKYGIPQNIVPSII